MRGRYKLRDEREPAKRRQLAVRLERGARRRLQYTHWAISQLLCTGPILPLEELSEQKLEAELKKDRETQARVKKRLSAEDARIEKSNTLVRRMEVEEQKLIEQLEHSQQLQHNAFAELQSTLGF